MKTRLFVATVILIFTNTACQKVILYSKGIRNPTIKSETSVSEFLRKRKTPIYDGSFVIRDSVSFISLVNRVRVFPSVAFFTPQGELIRINDSSYCVGVAHTFSSNLKAGAEVTIDSSYRLEELRKLVKPLQANNTLFENTGEYIVVGFWATYFGSVNENVFGVLDASTNNPEINTRIYLVNIFFLDSWGLKKKLNYKIN